MTDRPPLNRPPLCEKIGCPLRALFLTTHGPRCADHSKNLGRQPIDEQPGTYEGHWT